MTRIFYDIEFIDDGYAIELISLGMLREDTGNSLYYVSDNGVTLNRAASVEWLYENVVTQLPVKLVSDPARNSVHPIPDPNHADFAAFADISDIAIYVEDFIAGTPQPELWADGAYDHVCLAQLWGPMIELPSEVPMWTHDLRQLLELVTRLTGLTEKDIPPFLGPDGKQHAHNALFDACELAHNFGWLRDQLPGDVRKAYL